MEKQSTNIEETGRNPSQGAESCSNYGSQGGGGGDAEMESDYDWTRASRKQASKRRRRSTGGASTVETDFCVPNMSKDEFKNLATDDKLVTLFEMLGCTNKLSARVNNIKHSLKSVVSDNKITHSRLRTLEYRSIDAEARSRRNNLIFRGVPELYLEENCDALVRTFLSRDLELDPSNIYIQRAHRLGAPKRGKNRPIIACFRDSKDVDNILQNAHKLKNKPNLGINRDYPNEIVEARSRIWPEFKAARQNNPPRSVHIAYPAKLIVNKRVVRDEFPDWQIVLKESRYTKPPPSTASCKTSGQGLQASANMLQTQNRFEPLLEKQNEDESSTSVSDSSTDEPPDAYSQTMLSLEANLRQQRNDSDPPASQTSLPVHASRIEAVDLTRPTNG